MVYLVALSVKVIKYFLPRWMGMGAGPHISVCISSPKFCADGLILMVGMGRRVACAYMQASQSVTQESKSSSTPVMAPLVTSL